ncbi:MAG: GDSL-type esterase/lipase family protein [Bacteroidota bacterium]
MEQRNYEPLMILMVAGIFLLFMAVGVMHVFPEKHPVAMTPKSLPVTQPNKNPPDTVKSDSLQAILTDRDTISSTFTGLELFYQSIQRVQADHTLLHIAYFGDSMIEGDLITQPLRRSMQRRFGGNGLGFIPVTTPLPGFRTTVKQSFNDSWKIFSFVHSGSSAGVSPGISGYVYISEEGSEAKYESAPGYGPFHHAEILYGGKNNITLKVLTDTVSKILSLEPSAPVSSFTVSIDTAFSVFELDVTSASPGVFYGVNFENGPGVYVDNYAFRGNSGLPLNTIPPELFSGFNTILRNKLLILHYGLNVFTPGVEDYTWYEKAMENVIRHIKQSSPGISILMISMPDRSALILGEYQTPAALPGFIRLQQRVAAKEQVAFFNLYEAMGGANSMKKWVEGHPKMAGEDYTHPNGAGAAKIASLVYDYLMKGYERYLQKPDSLTFAKSSFPAL